MKGDDEALEFRLNDQVNEAYFLVYGFSSFLSPIIGSFIYARFEMKQTFDIVAIMNILFAILLYVQNCGPDVREENDEFVQKLEKLKLTQRFPSF